LTKLLIQKKIRSDSSLDVKSHDGNKNPHLEEASTQKYQCEKTMFVTISMIIWIHGVGTMVSYIAAVRHFFVWHIKKILSNQNIFRSVQNTLFPTPPTPGANSLTEQQAIGSQDTGSRDRVRILEPIPFLDYVFGFWVLVPYAYLVN
jgi:hypothetical protein